MTLIALSGGVDSSAAAALLVSQGHICIGAMMKLLDSPGENPRGCCISADSDDARGVCVMLGIPYYLLNLTAAFESAVIAPFRADYKQGYTPNPCISCNRHLKFGHFLTHAANLNCSHIATGHYARIVSDGGRWLLKRAQDTSKDQTYVLYFLTQAMLSRTIFPLGGLTKPEVRAIAAEFGLTTAHKRESQDICFAPKGGYADMLAGSATPGRFIDATGSTLGTHPGIAHYTIGQRKGIGLSFPRPMYVTKICPENNIITLGSEDMLYTNTLQACDINVISGKSLPDGVRCQAKIRYSHAPAPARAWQTSADRLHVEFEQPERAITPGQAVVLYDEDVVLGGGTIMRTP